MKRKSIPALLLALALIFSLGTTAFAAGSTTATVPVTLTVANEYRAVNVTVPASLPVYVINGTVVTADNARIKLLTLISIRRMRCRTECAFKGDWGLLPLTSKMKLATVRADFIFGVVGTTRHCLPVTPSIVSHACLETH